MIKYSFAVYEYANEENFHISVKDALLTFNKFDYVLLFWTNVHFYNIFHERINAYIK